MSDLPDGHKDASSSEDRGQDIDGEQDVSAIDVKEPSTEAEPVSQTPQEAPNMAKTEDPDSIEANIENSRSENFPPRTTPSITQPSLEQQLLKSKKDLESMVIKYAMSESNSLQMKSKVDDLDKKLKRAVKDNDQLANRIKILTNDKNHLSDTLSAKVAQLTVLEQKNIYLTNVQGNRLKELEGKCATLETTNEELQKQVDIYKSREGELLDFSERLSMKHMMLQTELDELLRLTKGDGGESKCDQQAKQLEELSGQVETLEARMEEQGLVIENLKTEKSNLEAKYQADLDGLNNELKMVRRKHQLLTKELVRQVKQLSGGINVQQ